MTVKHSMRSVEWYTPPDVVALARESLGGYIELDPASCDAAQAVVQAQRYGTAAKPLPSGLTHWACSSMWCNPPSPPMPWWERCVEVRHAHGARVVFLAYAIEQLSQIARLGYPRGARVVIPPKRIRYVARAADLATFYRVSAEKAKDPARCKILRNRAERLDAERPDSLHPGEAPPHASALVLLGADPAPWRREGYAVAEVVS